jgi:hypothetical protein
MKRINLLAIGLLVVVLAACGSSAESASTAESEAEAPSVAATPEPPESEAPESEAAEASDDEGTGSSGTPLADLLPDSIGGQSRQDIDFSDNQMVAAILQQQGVEIGDIDILLATYGTDQQALGVTAVRVPDMPQANMEMLARLMAGMPETAGSTETAEIGGKTVIAISPEGVDQVGYLYFADGAAFVIAGGTDDLAAELLSQLP